MPCMAPPGGRTRDGDSMLAVPTARQCFGPIGKIRSGELLAGLPCVARVRARGRGATMPVPVHTPDEIAALVFLDIAVIVVVARLMGMLFRRLRQPAVVGEILAGIILGPSLLGALPGDLTVR